MWKMSKILRFILFWVVSLLSVETKQKRLVNEDPMSIVVTLQKELNALKAEMSELKGRVGQTYIRWGRTTCPSLNGTEFVYNGYMAGGKWDQSGGGSNHLCLPGTPSWEKFLDGVNGDSEIYGTEIEVDSSVAQHLFGKEVDNQDVPCAVCRSNRASQVMLPARTACYDGWTKEYFGYVVGSKPAWAANSNYVCLDSDLEFFTGGAVNDDDSIVKPVEVRCGSLPCLPYFEGRELPCVVCTK